MADILPFRALRYDLARIKRIEDVVTPPYDVIGPREQESYLAASPYNIVRLELPQAGPDHGPDGGDGWAQKAGQWLRQWRQEGVLVRDPAGSFYYCETDYTAQGERRCRRGFIGLVRADEFGGAVRRHEMTFSRVKAGRLSLIRECRANLSPVFGLYEDPPDRAIEALRASAQGPPEVVFEDRGGCGHRLWRVSDAQKTLSEVVAALKDSLIVIADGHHRYETAVAYRQQMRATFPDAPPEAAFNYVMIYLCNSQDKGLTVLPSHRLLAAPEGFSLEEFDRRASVWFEVRHFSGANKTPFLAALAEGGRAGNAIGFYAGGGYRLLLLKEGVMSGPEAEGLPGPVRALDVVVFSRLLLQRVLNLPGDEDERLIQYISDTDRALQAAQETGRLAFLLNPTPVAQVQEVARQRLTMPRKSTYFYPKVMSGLTINPLEYPASDVF
ncbi:MAG: DUF1015 domain-containing protein [Pseudomonadota bacterium]